MASYDIAQYLLDRANIHDTVAKVSLYYDTGNTEALLAEIYAPSVEIDYTSIMGGEPYTIPRADWVARVGGMLQQFAATQHVSTCLVANLPQPGAGVARPDTATVHGQGLGNMVGKSESADGEASLVQNGGLIEVQLQRDAELEKQGQNPWRITKYKVIKKWNRGSVRDLAKE